MGIYCKICNRYLKSYTTNQIYCDNCKENYNTFKLNLKRFFIEIIEKIIGDVKTTA